MVCTLRGDEENEADAVDCIVESTSLTEGRSTGTTVTAPPGLTEIALGEATFRIIPPSIMHYLL